MARKAVAPDRKERFRYASGPLNGKWRWSYAEAVADAVRAGQAVIDPSNNDEICWLAGGRVECEEEPC